MDGARWIHESLAEVAGSSVLSREGIERMRQCYYGQVAFVDDRVGVLLEWMASRGLLENTIIAFLSDHGTHLGDFGLVQKQTFYEPVVRVPMFMSWEGVIPAGRRIQEPVSALTLLPSLLDLAEIAPAEGTEAPSIRTRPGATGGAREHSIVSQLLGMNGAPGGPVFSELTLGSFDMRHDDRLVMVRAGDWKLSLCLDPVPQDQVLVNLAEDPFERLNRWDDPSVLAVRDRLLALLDGHLDERAQVGRSENSGT